MVTTHILLREPFYMEGLRDLGGFRPFGHSVKREVGRSFIFCRSSLSISNSAKHRFCYEIDTPFSF